MSVIDPAAKTMSCGASAETAARKNIDVCLLGASLDTGNLGVSALAESSIKIILNRCPGANVTIFGGRSQIEHRMRLFDREVCVTNIPLRFCKNIFLPDHYCRFFLHALLFKVLGRKRARKLFAGRNPYVSAIREADMVVDILGGDSFSDIYGLFGFMQSFLIRWLIVMFKKKLVMLPQTYGPFKHRLARILAKHVLKHAGKIYSRDRAGLEYVRNLLGPRNAGAPIEFCPDVAFVLDAHHPQNSDVIRLEEMRKTRGVLVGLNASGLLWSGGFTRDNMFDLRVNYPDLLGGVIERLMQNENVVILLVPHVFSPERTVEDDPHACRQLYDSVRARYSDRVFLLDGAYDQNQIKYLIGTCDFFIGSRMHSCIAALSQCVPALGLAYSRKFHGVFESVGVEEFAVDMRHATTDEVLTTVDAAFKKRKATAEHLKAVIPGIQAQVLNMFNGVS